jgi:hypothetical protein
VPLVTHSFNKPSLSYSVLRRKPSNQDHARSNVGEKLHGCDIVTPRSQVSEMGFELRLVPKGRYMAKKFAWTNPSVLALADGADPVQTIEIKARELALKAMDDGWGGPPFDPLALAEWLGIAIDARSDIPDARLVPSDKGSLVLEYNPMRPRGRLRFSIAHEIAHTLFDDCAKDVRNRGVSPDEGRDNWQLEVLCNIGAAELLMPLGSFSQLAGESLSINTVMEVRKSFDVSVEACLIRLVKLARTPCAAFCASKHSDGMYRADYVIPTLGWDCPIRVGQVVPAESAVNDVTAIGFTAVASEAWSNDRRLRVECVGLAPYPGSVTPRVVGMLVALSSEGYSPPEIVEVDGDALTPRGKGAKIVAHVVPNTSSAWGGNGFASQVRRRHPNIWAQFRSETSLHKRVPGLGEVFFGSLGDGVTVAHMVAQKGFGETAVQRLQYSALSECLGILRASALELGASVHMPRVGTGHGGANWNVVKELISDELVDKGVATTVYRLPS